MLLIDLWVGKFDVCRKSDILVSRTRGEAQAGLEQFTPRIGKVSGLEKAYQDIEYQ